MTVDVLGFDLDEEEKRIGRGGFSGVAYADTKVHLDQIEDKAEQLRIRKTIGKRHRIEETSHPHVADEPVGKTRKVELGLSPPAGLTEAQLLLEEHVGRLKEIETQLTGDHPPAPYILDFPNLAWEAVKTVLLKEEITNRQLNGHIETVEKHQKDLDLLLDFSSELTGYKEDTTEMSEKMKDLLAKLKERGIDLWKGEELTLSKEKIAELKSLSSAQVDKLRSNLQIIFTTKIQVLIQALGSIMEALKNIVQNNNRLISAINQAMKGR